MTNDRIFTHMGFILCLASIVPFRKVVVCWMQDVDNV